MGGIFFDINGQKMTLFISAVLHVTIGCYQSYFLPLNSGKTILSTSLIFSISQTVLHFLYRPSIPRYQYKGFISRREGTLYSRSANTFATFCVTGSRPLSPCLYSLCTVKDAKADARRPSSTKALTSHNSLCMPNCTSRHH